MNGTPSEHAADGLQPGDSRDAGDSAPSPRRTSQVEWVEIAKAALFEASQGGDVDLSQACEITTQWLARAKGG